MAENYTPEEIQEIFDAYNEAIKNGTPISKEFAQQLKDASLGVKNYSKSLKASLDQLGGSLKSLGSDMYKGKQGASVFNDSIEKGADVVAKYTSKFGILGEAVGAVIKVLTLYVSAVNKQSDALFKSYQDLSRAGAIGAGGMTELRDSMKNLGFGIEELDRVVSIISENSKALANFGGTTIEGTKTFSELANEIRRSEIGQRLMEAGLSVEEMDRGIAGFLKQQTLLGRNQADMSKSLNREASAYLENLEAMARLTGQDRKAMEAKMQDAMNEQAFNRRLSVLKEKAAAGDQAAAKEAEKLEMLNLTLEGEARKEFLAAQAGDMSRASKLLLTAPEFIQAVRDPSKSAAQALDAFAKGSKQRIDSMGDLALYNAWNDSFINMTELQEFQAKYGKKAAQDLIDEARRQVKTNDSSVKSQVKLQTSQRDIRDSLQDLVGMGIEPVTDAMATLATVVSGLTDMLPGSAAAKTAMQARKETRALGQAPTRVVGGKTYKVNADGSLGEEVTDFGMKASGKAASKDLYAGLKMKSGEATGGGESDERIVALAQRVQGAFGADIKYFSAFNDKYHQTLDRDSAHKKGRAMDIVLNDPAMAEEFAAQLKSFGGGVFSNVINEYKNPSAGSVGGGHIHAEISAMNGFSGVLSGPNSGYRPNLEMHGTEAITIQPMGSSSGSSTTGGGSDVMGAQLAKLDQLVDLMSKQVNLSNKLLTYNS